MGSAKLNLTSLELGRATDITLKLEDTSRPNRILGELRINVTLWPKTQEDKEQVTILFSLNRRSFFKLIFHNYILKFLSKKISVRLL